MILNEAVINVLSNSKVDGSNLFLPEGTLDRALYVAVDKALKALGGKWNRKAGAHIFPNCPDDAIEQLIQTGEYTSEKKEYQFFETPVELAKRIVDIANIQEDESVLEPSAGQARIARAIPKHCFLSLIELNDTNREILVDSGYNLVHSDFMSYQERHDVIVANPPFSKQQDVDHVTHMIELANRVVVAVMSAAVIWRTNKKTVEFRELVESFGGTIEPLPDETFKESGTLVKTVLVTVHK